MDEIDRRILEALQHDANLSVRDLAEKVRTSEPTCWRRIRALEKAGVIKARVAIVDPEAINLGLTGFILVRTEKHNEAWTKHFAEGVARIPEVVEFHRMTGDVDYLLKIVAPDIRGYDDVYKRLIKVADLSDVSASFSMETLKSTTVLPLTYVTE